MADLKFGNVTPAVGNIKLGSNNVSEIYQGATKLWPLGSAPQPGEVTVCDLIWTKTNSTITATTTGGNIPIVTNQNDWITKCQNNDPAACYWQFDSNNAFKGLYYNVFAAEVIQPPTGFRVPTQQDWQDLIDCAEIGGSTGNDVTSLGNNYYGFWPSNVASNSRFGTVDFNSIGAGYTYQNSTTIPPSVPQGWASQGERDLYHQKQTWPSLPASYYPVTMVWHRNYNPPDVLVGYATASFNDGFQSGKNFGALIRFVKDVPTSTVELYDCAQPSQCSEVSVVDHSFTRPSSGTGFTNNPYMSIIVPTQQSWSPTWEICVNQPNSIFVTQLQLRLYSDTLRQNLVHTYQKNIDPSDQSPPCNTPEIFTFTDTTLAPGTYYCRTLVYNNRGGTGPFVITALIS